MDRPLIECLNWRGRGILFVRSDVSVPSVLHPFAGEHECRSPILVILPADTQVCHQSHCCDFRNQGRENTGRKGLSVLSHTSTSLERSQAVESYTMFLFNFSSEFCSAHFLHTFARARHPFALYVDHPQS